MLRLGREFLARKGLAEARLDAEWLVAHALGLDRLRLFMALDRPVTPAELERGRELLARRAKHEPVAYLVGRREFYGRVFAVDRAVLIPRPETELLIDRAREFVAESPLAAPRALDVGTGSGVIAISLALEVPSASVVAVDISAAALDVARANAARHALAAPRLTLLESDGATAAASHGPFDLILSNPPYVARETAASLAPEVRDHEPALALFAPAGDRDHWLKRLLAEAKGLLTPAGRAWIELGFDQADAARALAAHHGWNARVHADLAKLPRVLEVWR